VLETIGFLGTGAALGALVALAFELTGHRWWAMLMLLASAAALSVRSISSFGVSTPHARSRLSGTAKIAVVLLMIATTLAVEWATNINPRDYAYVPLLPPILLAAAFFGFGYGVLAIVICTVAADYFFSLPIYDFRITEIEDVVGLSVFAVLGACLAWLLQQGFPPYEDRSG
jgi:K+-sensing histidine kinase KdpD